MLYLSKPLELSSQSEYFSVDEIIEVKTMKYMGLHVDSKTGKVIKDCRA